MLFKKIQTYLFSILLIVFLLFAMLINADAQNIPLIVQNQYFNKQKQNLQDTLSSRTGIESPFVVGVYYNPVTNSESNHPYFKENKWTKGTLIYQGKFYTVENLKYDIEIDKLIYLLYDKDNSMNCVALDENFICGFSVLKSTFKYFNGLKNDTGRKLKPGYYEVVYDGKLKFLVRSEKSESMNNYSSTTSLFLLKDGNMFGISTMSKLIFQLKDKEKMVKEFVNENSLKLNKSDYTSAALILKFYENL